MPLASLMNFFDVAIYLIAVCVQYRLNSRIDRVRIKIDTSTCYLNKYTDYKHRDDSMHTPRKYLYHLKGRPKELDNRNYVVVIKELYPDKSEQVKPMTLKQVTQFITLIEKTGHCSTFGHNYLRLSGGRISFIDTDGTFNKKNPIRGIIGLLNHDLATYYTPDALYYIIDRIAQHLGDLPDWDCEKPLRMIHEFIGEQPKDLRKKLRLVLKECLGKYD